MRLVTRFVSSTLAILALSSLAGCATQTTASGGTLRGDDTAVRAEARRISNTGPLGERGIRERTHVRGASF